MKRYLDKIFFEKSNTYQSRIIGIILILIGTIFLFKNTAFYTKIGTTLMLIGCLVLFLIMGKSEPKKVSGTHITLIIIAWILLVFFISNDIELETYITLILIGVISIKELTYEFTPYHLKKRFDLFVFGFVILFFVIAGQKIISILGI